MWAQRWPRPCSPQLPVPDAGWAPPRAPRSTPLKKEPLSPGLSDFTLRKLQGAQEKRPERKPHDADSACLWVAAFPAFPCFYVSCHDHDNWGLARQLPWVGTLLPLSPEKKMEFYTYFCSLKERLLSNCPGSHGDWALPLPGPCANGKLRLLQKCRAGGGDGKGEGNSVPASVAPTQAWESKRRPCGPCLWPCTTRYAQMDKKEWRKLSKQKWTWPVSPPQSLWLCPKWIISINVSYQVFLI